MNESDLKERKIKNCIVDHFPGCILADINIIIIISENNIDEANLSELTPETIAVLIPDSDDRIKFQNKLRECGTEVTENVLASLINANNYELRNVLLLLIQKDNIYKLIEADSFGESILFGYKTSRKLTESQRNRITECIVEQMIKHSDLWQNPHFKAIANVLVEIFPSESIDTYYVAPVPVDRSQGIEGSISKGKIPTKYRNSKHEINVNKGLVSRKRKCDEEEFSDLADEWLNINVAPEETAIEKWKLTEDFKSSGLRTGGFKTLDWVLSQWPLLASVNLTTELINNNFLANFTVPKAAITEFGSNFFDILDAEQPVRRDSHISGLKELMQAKSTPDDHKFLAGLHLLAYYYPPTASIYHSVTEKENTRGKLSDAEGSSKKKKRQVRTKFSCLDAFESIVRFVEVKIA